MICLDIAGVQARLRYSGLRDLGLHHLTVHASPDASGKLQQRSIGNLSDTPLAQSMSIPLAITHRLWATEPPTCLVWVFEHGIWASSENLSLYYAWRRALGVLTLLEDAPGHVFLPFEHDHMVSLVQMALLFGWGIACVSGDSTAAFTIDHDGALVAFADTPERVEQLCTNLPMPKAAS
jgi:hypothetical protein